MSASQGCIDDKVVVESFTEALKGRIGEDRYRMWFSQGVEFEFQFDSPTDQTAGKLHGEDDRSSDDDSSRAGPNLHAHARMNVHVRGQFALDRLRQHFLQPLRGAAMQACGCRVDVQLVLCHGPAEQSELPLSGSEHSGAAVAHSRRRTPAARRRRGSQSLGTLIADSSDEKRERESARRTATDVRQLEFPALRGSATGSPNSPAEPVNQSSPDVAPPAHEMSARNFVAGTCNQLAHTAMTMVCQNPSTATPLFLCGPTGTGKTHLMTAIAEQLRRRHRMRRVMQLSAEQFTNDFISSVGNSGITAFRRRYREVDALLIDDVQFLGAKKATLREMLYTVETLAGAGRPLIFSGLHAPTEIAGLSHELAGRMAAGLVCSLQPLDATTRETILRRWIQQRCDTEVPDEMIREINLTLAGDGRVLSGVVNVVNTLQRMLRRNPTMEELRRYAGDLLRSSAPLATLGVIESAVCEAFHLEPNTLRGGSQTRAVTEPRMLAMYLSRQLTSAAYSEIARHFGGKSHSTAISAENNIKAWMENGKPIGRGPTAMSVREALDRVEGLLRTG